MKDRLLRILHNRVHSVIRGMKNMATRQGLSKDERANVDAACHYFTAHAHRMKYDEYLAASLPIATGIIEGACRHLVKDRLERTGMRWSTEGAQGMLNLRSIRASSLWDDFQKHYFSTSSLKGDESGHIDHRDEPSGRVPGFLRLVVRRHFEAVEISLGSEPAARLERNLKGWFSVFGFRKVAEVRLSENLKPNTSNLR